MVTLQEIKQQYLDKALNTPINSYCIKDRHGNILAQSNVKNVHIYTDDADKEWAIEGNHYKVESTFEADRPDGKVLLTRFWMKPSDDSLLRSLDGKYYTYANLPEQNDDFVLENYKKEIKGERNSRLYDTDKYMQTPDITVKRSENGNSEPLTDEDKDYLTVYRMALRDMPELENFPFVEFPPLPECLAYELQKQIDYRVSMRERNDTLF